MPRPAFLALLVLLAPLPTRAADMLTVLEQARLHDPVYLAAEARYRASATLTYQAGALMLPEITATGSRQRHEDEQVTDPGGPTETRTTADYDSDSYVLELRQALFDAAAWAGWQQAKATVRQAEANWQTAQRSLLLRVAETYFGLLRAQDNLGLARAERKAIERQLELANARLEVGLAAITEVHEARARYELSRARVITEENALEDARDQLATLTGTRFTVNGATARDALRPLQEQIIKLDIQPPELQAWLDLAAKQNWGLLAAQAAVDVAREEVKRQRAGHLPTLDIVGARTRSESDSSLTTPGTGIETDGNRIGLELKLPLIQGGLTLARTREAVHQLTAAEQDYEKTRRDTVRSVRQAFLGVISGEQQLHALKQSVIAGESALQAKTEGFQAGINTNQDVLDAQRDLFAAKRDYQSARYDHILNLLRLKESAALLGDDDIKQVNQWLEK